MRLLTTAVLLTLCLTSHAVIPTLVPGTGWTEGTPQPDPIGTGFGADAKALARWDVVPYQTVECLCEVGVVAFHINGIDRVEFSAENGPWLSVTTPTLNPRTNAVEYWVRLDCQGIPDGPVEVRAIAYPVTGIPRVLGLYEIDQSYAHSAGEDLPWATGEHSMVLIANKSGTYSYNKTAWVATNGNDTTGNGTEEAPYLTVQKAVDALKAAGKIDGATVYLKAGTYSAIGLNLVSNNLTTWLTICSAPGVNRDSVIIRNMNTRTQCEMLRFKSVRFQIPITKTDRLFYGGVANGSRYLWLDDVAIVGDARTNKIPIWNDMQAVFATNVLLENNARGFSGTIMRNVTMRRMGDDCFTDSKLVVKGTVIDVNKELANNAGAHCDIMQFYDPTLSEENTILHGLTAVDRIGSQGVFAGTACKDIALVGVNITQVAGPNHSFTFGDVNNLYVKDCVFQGATGKMNIVDANRVKNVCLENSRFSSVSPYKPNGWDQPGVVWK